MAYRPDRPNYLRLKGTIMTAQRLDSAIMSPFTRELRRLGKQTNAFGGYDDLENALYKAASILDDYAQLAEMVTDLLGLIEQLQSEKNADH